MAGDPIFRSGFCGENLRHAGAFLRDLHAELAAINLSNACYFYA